jgi:K+-transporting ATPase A subunit
MGELIGNIFLFIFFSIFIVWFFLARGVQGTYRLCKYETIAVPMFWASIVLTPLVPLAILAVLLAIRGYKAWKRNASPHAVSRRLS